MSRFLTALPVYNEAPHIHEVLKAVRQYSDEILVVNDGSTDETAQVLAQEPGIHILTHAKNSGYGAALRSAFEFALSSDYEALVTIDCDGQHQPELIPNLVAALDSNDKEWDIVSGSRYLAQLPGNSLPPEDRRRINLEITALLNCLLGMNLTDTFCGFKSYRVRSLRHFQIDELGYAMPLQLWIQAAAAGLLVREYPVPLVYLDENRSFGGSLDDSRKRLAYYREVIDRELSKHRFALDRTTNKFAEERTMNKFPLEGTMNEFPSREERLRSDVNEFSQTCPDSIPCDA